MLGCFPDLTSMRDQANTEGSLKPHALSHHVRVAGLEDPQGQHPARKQYGGQRKQSE